MAVVVVGCSLTASLDGLYGGPLPADGGAPDQGSSGASEGGQSADGGAAGTGPLGCTRDEDTACAFADDGNVEADWAIANNTGSWSLVASTVSPPSALSFLMPNAGSGSSLGPRFQRLFPGAYASLTCSFEAALDELPSDGAVDIMTAAVASPTADDVGLRVFDDDFGLISCRNSSDCRPIVDAGILPTLGTYHRYELTWRGDGGYVFTLDGTQRAMTNTKTPLTTPSELTIRFGLVYRPYGAGGTFRARVDNLRCFRAR